MYIDIFLLIYIRKARRGSEIKTSNRSGVIWKTWLKIIFKFPSVILLTEELSATLRNKMKILPKISLFAFDRNTVTFDIAVIA
jgi:hypothetical protein